MKISGCIEKEIKIICYLDGGDYWYLVMYIVDYCLEENN